MEDMIRKRLKECRLFIAGDGSRLREILNPKKEARLKIRYSLARVSVAPKEETKPHVLIVSEVYIILHGRGIMRIGRERKEVKAGDTVYIPSGSIQQIRNSSRRPLVFLCIVDPAWTPACEKILPDRRRFPS